MNDKPTGWEIALMLFVLGSMFRSCDADRRIKKLEAQIVAIEECPQKTKGEPQ